VSWGGFLGRHEPIRVREQRREQHPVHFYRYLQLPGLRGLCHLSAWCGSYCDYSQSHGESKSDSRRNTPFDHRTVSGSSVFLQRKGLACTPGRRPSLTTAPVFRVWRQYLGVTVILAVLAPIWTNDAQAVQTLSQVCAPGGANQMATLCQAAYSNGNTSFILDNNARVRGSVAVVSAVSCMSGDPGACSSAVDNGYQAYDYHNDSKAAFTSAQTNGQTALALSSSASTIQGNGITSQGGTNAGQPGSSPAIAGSAAVVEMPAACAQAVAGGVVGDRIACAIASDPTVPAMVRDPQFPANFQNATGVSLQSVMNKSPGEVASYLPMALEHAYAGVKDRVSLADFLMRKNQLLGALTQRIPSKGGIISPAMTEVAKAAPPLASPEPALEASAEKTDRSPAAQPLEVSQSDDGRELSLFERVSKKYHSFSISLQTVQSVILPDWHANRSN
jgi:hypothetical protein